jgi:hypothetical protein
MKVQGTTDSDWFVQAHNSPVAVSMVHPSIWLSIPGAAVSFQMGISAFSNSTQ